MRPRKDMASATRGLGLVRRAASAAAPPLGFSVAQKLNSNGPRRNKTLEDSLRGEQDSPLSPGVGSREHDGTTPQSLVRLDSRSKARRSATLTSPHSVITEPHFFVSRTSFYSLQRFPIKSFYFRRLIRMRKTSLRSCAGSQ